MEAGSDPSVDYNSWPSDVCHTERLNGCPLKALEDTMANQLHAYMSKIRTLIPEHAHSRACAPHALFIERIVGPRQTRVRRVSDLGGGEKCQPKKVSNASVYHVCEQEVKMPGHHHHVQEVANNFNIDTVSKELVDVLHKRSITRVKNFSRAWLEGLSNHKTI